MKQAKRVAVSSNEFGAVLEIINAHRAKALVSVNVEHLLTNWEIGGYLSAKIKHEGWGKSTIDNLVDYIHTHAPRERGYGRSNLYSMVAVYDEFTSPEFAELLKAAAEKSISATYVFRPDYLFPFCRKSKVAVHGTVKIIKSFT